MVYYIIKVTQRAKKANPNFDKGATLVTYYGKGHELIGHYVSYGEDFKAETPLTEWAIEEYGYTRKGAAARSEMFKDSVDRLDSRYWEAVAEIVEVA